MTKQITPLIL